MKRLQGALGDSASRFGSFVAGSGAASLRHRHDVRMGIASGMFLKEHIASAATRIEILCVVYICYWKWSAKAFLDGLMKRIAEMESAGASRRAEIYEGAWEHMMREVRPDELTVASNRYLCRVDLVARQEKRRLGGCASGHFYYHPVMKPAGRRTGQREFSVLVQNVRDGKLLHACRKLAVNFASGGSTYIDGEKLLRPIELWRKTTSHRTMVLRWLLQAEGVVVEAGPADWELLKRMGSGAKKGVDAAGGLTYDDAAAVCKLISGDIWAGSGADYRLDDLICFLCLSQYAGAVDSGSLALPAPAVTIAGDLGMGTSPLAEAAGAYAPARRMRAKKPVASGAERAAAPARKAHAACAAAAVAHKDDGASVSAALPLLRGGLPRQRRPGCESEILPSPQLSLEAVVAEIAPFLLQLATVPEQVALCRCSTFLHAKCMLHVSGWGPRCWSRVSEKVKEMLSVSGAAGAAVTASCAARGSLCRALGCALDTIESLRLYPLPADEGLLAVALARYAFKYELTSPDLDVALLHLADPRAHGVECELLMMVGRRA